jgi:basic membrane protein A and related proteins
LSAPHSRRALLGLAGKLLAGGAAATALAACRASGEPVARRSESAPASPISAAQSSAQGQKRLKAGFVYLATPHDRGWTAAHDDGRKFLESTLRGQVETAFAENVPETEESRPIFDYFAEKGFDVVYGTSFGYMDHILATAAKYPDVKFEHNGGFKTAPNLATYSGAQEDGRYVGGILSGKMTKSNVLGFIGSFPIPEVIRYMNSWALGVKSVNPAAKILMTWINTWFDPPTEAAAANSLLDLGADVLTSVTDSPAMAQAAAARRRYSLGSDSDQADYAPDFILASAYWQWGVHYVRSVNSIIDGNWKNDQAYYHMSDGVSLITPPAKFVPPDVAQFASDAVQQLKASSLNIWKGPIRDNKGKLIAAQGQTLGDVFAGEPLPGQTREDAYVQSDQMSWALENVVGDIPNP